MDKQALRARYPQAFAWLEARNVEPSDAFYTRLDALRGQAWTVAKLATIEQIEQVKSSLIKALQSGQSFVEWQKALTPDMLALPKHYRETVFRNAMQASYNGAKWAHFRDNPHRPILRYVAVNDSRTRPSHKALHGLMMPMDDPRWQTLAPSNGHGCRCTLMSLSERQAKAMGYDGAPKDLPTWTDKHGHDHVCQPDKGWAHSPENQDLTAYLREKERKAGLSRAMYNEEMPIIKSVRTPWADNFPDTVIDRPLGDATKHPSYEAAKAGDADAALKVAQDLVTDDAAEKIRKIMNGREAVIIPVHAEEAVGRNAIPVMTAAVLGKKVGASVDTEIVQAIKVSRTGSDGWHRIANPPYFDGDIPAGTLVIMVDDTQTQGGTFAALKGHIEVQGAHVIGAYALTGKQYSVQLRLSADTLEQLRGKYESIETWWETVFGYNFEYLTEWEARYILKSGKSPDDVRNLIIAKKQI